MVIRTRKRASELSKEELVEMVSKLRGLLYGARDERLDQGEIDEVLDATAFDNDLDLFGIRMEETEQLIQPKKEREKQMETGKCQKCGSVRIFGFTGKCSDLSSGTFKNATFEGYFPHVQNLGGGDYIEVDVCLECGQAQGDWPVEDPDFEGC